MADKAVMSLMSEISMPIRLLFFANFKDLSGTRHVHLDIPQGTTVNSLKHIISEQFPSLARALPTAVVAVNHEFASDDQEIPEEAEVAFFPPVSGGSSEFPTLVSITEESIDLDALMEQITLPATGAACLFSGMVRGVTTRENPHETTYLEYEAYAPMAEAKMRQVAEEIRARFPAVQGIAIVQRIGRLYPGTPTVLIACTAAHRDTGVFEASRYGIDRLKEIVPVWKKEIGTQGQVWVEGDYVPKPGE